MSLQAEQLLDADRDGRAGFRLVVDGDAVAGWRLEVARRFGIQSEPQVKGQKRVKG